MTTASPQREILLESGTNELEVLVFTLDGQRYGVNVAKVREVIETLRVTALPEAHRVLMGVFQLRETVTPLVDLQHALGRPPSDPAKGKIIIMEFNEMRVGFLVDTVEQIYRVNWEEVSGIPDLEGIREAPMTSVANIDGNMVLMIDFEKLMFDIGGVDLFEESAKRIEQNMGRSDRRLLLAEDSNMMRTLIKGNLVQAGFTDVTVCTDGQNAWDCLEKSISDHGQLAFDLIITDIEMPRIDGLHLCKRIREHPQMKDIPVVIFSSLVSVDNEKKCRSVGANAQITKPQLDKLVDLVDSLIEEAEQKARGIAAPA